MKIIAGLGNPGKKLENTRHNLGFMAVDRIAERLGINWKTDRKSTTLKALKFTENTGGSKVILVKPQTFMNSSGEAVKKVFQYYNKTTRTAKTTKTLQHYSNLYIIHDDLDIPLGEYKIQFSRGSAGHKGVESIIKELGTKDFWRVRIGVENRKGEPHFAKATRGEDYVLQKFGKEEKKIIDGVIEKAIQEIRDLL